MDKRMTLSLGYGDLVDEVLEEARRGQSALVQQLEIDGERCIAHFVSRHTRVRTFVDALRWHQEQRVHTVLLD